MISVGIVLAALNFVQAEASRMWLMGVAGCGGGGGGGGCAWGGCLLTHTGEFVSFI